MDDFYDNVFKKFLYIDFFDYFFRKSFFSKSAFLLVLLENIDHMK